MVSTAILSLTSASTADFAENGTGSAYTPTTSEPYPGATLAYGIGGKDAALFNINKFNGAVSFKAAPNFEAAADAGSDNVYNIIVAVTDGAYMAFRHHSVYLHRYPLW